MYEHLGPFSDLLRASPAADLDGQAPDTAWTRTRVRELLRFGPSDAEPGGPAEVRVERSWRSGGVAGEEVSWSVGYGPRTHAYVLRPADASGPLPGVLALHCHGGFKYYGKEKIADGPSAPAAEVVDARARMYGDRAYANQLAEQGFVVVVPDVFLWGSRRFPLSTMPEQTRARANADGAGSAGEIAGYNAAAGEHEHLVEKYCTALGTTLAAVVAYEDRVAVSYLRSRTDVRPEAIGCVGLSGGGCRSALLYATCDDVRAAVVVGMMSDYAGLLDHNVASHTWMFFPAGLARHCDWPDLAACRAPSPLLVQYDREDQLFTPDGMRAADDRIREHYERAGGPDAYEGQWYHGPHKFDLPMQRAAFDWLAARLRP